MYITLLCFLFLLFFIIFPFLPPPPKALAKGIDLIDEALLQALETNDVDTSPEEVVEAAKAVTQATSNLVISRAASSSSSSSSSSTLILVFFLRIFFNPIINDIDTFSHYFPGTKLGQNKVAATTAITADSVVDLIRLCNQCSESVEDEDVRDRLAGISCKGFYVGLHFGSTKSSLFSNRCEALVLLH